MQTLYGYKGNTPIIAQYGVHEFWGSDVKRARRGEKRETRRRNDKKNKTSIQRSNTMPEVVCRVEEGAQAQVREGWIYKK